ncbi:DoxX family protein [Pseudomonas sp. R2.Fl]|nr:DoxX family protein [Pseudomonas sp. R2.Fl]
MVHALSIWFLIVAFAGAGFVNAIGAAGTRDDFVKWGYPRWWGIVTGGLEILAAALIGFPLTRFVGVVLGASIIAAAVITVLRQRDYAHLAPLSIFVTLMSLTTISS